MVHISYLLGPDSPLEHPRKVMKEMGITYIAAMPFTIADQIWFVGCNKAPNPLPKYMSILEGFEDAQKFIEFGFSQEVVDKLKFGATKSEKH